MSYKATEIIVVAGTNSLSRGGDKYNLKSCIEHNKYDKRNLANDIAVCKLDKKFKYGAKVNNTMLAEKNPKGGDKLLLTGWGYTNYHKETTPDKLQMLDMTALTQNECRSNYTKTKSFPTIDDTRICAFAGQNKGGCYGDSGGPLVLREGTKEQVGIVSYGVPCARGYGDVYISVAHFRDWIEKNTS